VIEVARVRDFRYERAENRGDRPDRSEDKYGNLEEKGTCRGGYFSATKRKRKETRKEKERIGLSYAKRALCH
jgi:hypothetical protein